MSARISMLRDALSGLIDAAEALPIASGPLTRRARLARIALHATRFVAPDAFPARVSTRSGATVILLALHDGRLVGTYVDSDGPQLHSWCADGAMFATADPDDFDLVLPDDAPLAAADARIGTVHHLTPADSNAHDGDELRGEIIRLPILGRIS